MPSNPRSAGAGISFGLVVIIAVYAYTQVGWFRAGIDSLSASVNKTNTPESIDRIPEITVPAFDLELPTGPSDPEEGDVGDPPTDDGPAQPGVPATEVFDFTGAEPGLADTSTPERRAQAQAVISELRTAGRGPKTGYDRARFGPAWTDNNEAGLFSGNGCDTRNDILARDLIDVELRDGDCIVATGHLLIEPYTGEQFVFGPDTSSSLHIDHIVSLSAAWQMGAAYWDDARRTAFANDPLNLIATDGPQNMAKGDSTPASWLPPNRQVRCSFVLRYAQVSLAYDLPVTEADKALMADQCNP